MSVEWHDCEECNGNGFAIHCHSKERVPCIKCDGGGERPICPDCEIPMTSTQISKFACHRCGLTVREE